MCVRACFRVSAHMCRFVRVRVPACALMCPDMSARVLHSVCARMIEEEKEWIRHAHSGVRTCKKKSM